MNREQQVYQEYGIDATGTITHAGIVNAPRMSAKVAKKIQHKWQGWRSRYLQDNPGDYPLRHCKKTVQLILWPLGHWDKRKYFDVA